ncbi:hypothetical protein VKT23_010109 [Stygiomarasmius scandens]|uniref:Uncharacterized protein n=1 Tax=Marasmiellus scandens TaxID=2682957 RepID=A0ABR1JET9_9AGAR
MNSEHPLMNVLGNEIANVLGSIAYRQQVAIISVCLAYEVAVDMLSFSFATKPIHESTPTWDQRVQASAKSVLPPSAAEMWFLLINVSNMIQQVIVGQN